MTAALLVRMDEEGASARDMARAVTVPAAFAAELECHEAVWFGEGQDGKGPECAGAR